MITLPPFEGGGRCPGTSKRVKNVCGLRFTDDEGISIEARDSGDHLSDRDQKTTHTGTSSDSSLVHELGSNIHGLYDHSLTC